MYSSYNEKTCHQCFIWDFYQCRPGRLVEWLTRLTYDPRRVSARVRSRPGHIQSCEYKKRVCRMRLKTVVPYLSVYAIKESKRPVTGGQ
jgi:hypothetical protein